MIGKFGFIKTLEKRVSKVLGDQWKVVYNGVNISFLIRLSDDSDADREFHCTKDKLNREEKVLRRYRFQSGRGKFKDGGDNCRNSY